MHDIHTRMTGLHNLLTGDPHPPARRRTYPTRHLWGDLGLAEVRARAPWRSLPARLQWW